MMLGSHQEALFSAELILQIERSGVGHAQRRGMQTVC